jgi:2C-methyl-D-erythritol 2,4-cyclodiphosphate synthase
MEPSSWLKQNAVSLALAAMTISSSFVITQQSTSDNTRRITNVEKYTRVKSAELKLVEVDVAVLKEQQKTNAVNNSEISDLLNQTVTELKSTRLAVERLSAKVDG